MSSLHLAVMYVCMYVYMYVYICVYVMYVCTCVIFICVSLAPEWTIYSYSSFNNLSILDRFQLNLNILSKKMLACQISPEAQNRYFLKIPIFG
jgi:hypothetical protein